MTGGAFGAEGAAVLAVHQGQRPSPRPEAVTKARGRHQARGTPVGTAKARGRQSTAPPRPEAITGSGAVVDASVIRCQQESQIE